MVTRSILKKLSKINDDKLKREMIIEIAMESYESLSREEIEEIIDRKYNDKGYSLVDTAVSAILGIAVCIVCWSFVGSIYTVNMALLWMNALAASMLAIMCLAASILELSEFNHLNVYRFNNVLKSCSAGALLLQVLIVLVF